MYREATFKWKPLSWIPNEKGFRFIGKLKNDISILCEVVKDGDVHRIKQGNITDFQSWRDITQEDEELLKN